MALITSTSSPKWGQKRAQCPHRTPDIIQWSHEYETRARKRNGDPQQPFDLQDICFCFFVITDRCSLTFDPRTANGHLFLSQENRRAEHLTSGPRPVPAHEARFDHTWQVLCFQGFTHGQHYWELEVSKPWAYLGVKTLRMYCLHISFRMDH